MTPADFRQLATLQLRRHPPLSQRSYASCISMTSPDSRLNPAHPRTADRRDLTSSCRWALCPVRLPICSPSPRPSPIHLTVRRAEVGMDSSPIDSANEVSQVTRSDWSPKDLKVADATGLQTPKSLSGSADPLSSIPLQILAPRSSAQASVSTSAPRAPRLTSPQRPPPARTRSARRTRISSTSQPEWQRARRWRYTEPAPSSGQPASPSANRQRPQQPALPSSPEGTVTGPPQRHQTK